MSGAAFPTWRATAYEPGGGSEIFTWLAKDISPHLLPICLFYLNNSAARGVVLRAKKEMLQPNLSWTIIKTLRWYETLIGAISQEALFLLESFSPSRNHFNTLIFILLIFILFSEIKKKKIDQNIEEKKNVIVLRKKKLIALLKVLKTF